MVVARRTDLHNSEIDDDAAYAGLCGMTHLATGRCCLLPARHIGSCRFVAPHPVHLAHPVSPSVPTPSVG
jgi:hypothetical protein